MKSIHKIFFIFASLLVFVNCAVRYQDGRKAFIAFNLKYNITYPTLTAKLAAFKKFIVLWRYIQLHNRAYINEETPFSLAINKIASLTPAQIETLTTGNKLPPYEFSNYTVRPKNVITVTTTMFPRGPNFVDWNAAGFVTPVKDQSFYCASCWAFSAIAALESALAIKTGVLVRASEQNLIDCNYNLRTGNFGCRGGSQASAYMYVKFQPGIASESAYPYAQLDRFVFQSCRYNQSTSIGGAEGYARILPGNETLLRDVVASVGPVGFAMNGATRSFLYYSSGIYNDPACTPGTDHSALIYGYGTARFRNGSTIDYWFCKNSWSSDWGEAGYFKMVRGRNMCGLTGYLIYPLV